MNDLIAEVKALLDSFDGAMWNGSPASLLQALERLRVAVKEAEERQ